MAAASCRKAHLKQTEDHGAAEEPVGMGDNAQAVTAHTMRQRLALRPIKLGCTALEMPVATARIMA
jgi:hypothetical protein